MFFVLIPSSPHTVRDYGLIKATVGFNSHPPPTTNTTLSSPNQYLGNHMWLSIEQVLYEDELTLLCILCGLDSHAWTLKNTQKNNILVKYQLLCIHS
jgi:hypothetical protein